jgi:hypothetical protein
MEGTMREKYEIWANGKAISRITGARKARLLYDLARNNNPKADVRLYQERGEGLGMKQILPKLGIAS